MPVFEKNYKIAAGELKIKITYWSTINGVLDFGIINIGELEYGYEDEDQLTFFPNVFRMEFTDFERKNYAILKYSLDNYPEQKHEDTGRIEVFLNGSTYPLYDGYIDQETLTYDEEKRVTLFEAVDFILELKNITTFDINKAIGYPAGPPKHLADLPTVLLQIYRKIYPDLRLTFTNSITEFNKPEFNGFYWDHNWKFYAYDSSLNEKIATWNNSPLIPIFAFYQYFWDEKYEMETLAELIRQLSKEFGAIIGSTAKNKVFFTKKYGKFTGATNALDNNIISGSLNKTLHLKKVQSVKNNNEGGTVTQGTYQANPDRAGLPKNKYNNLEMKTYMWTNSISSSNVELYTTGSSPYKVGEGIVDADINPNTRWKIQNLITYYTYVCRTRSRDKYDMELNGIDYDLFKVYPLNIATGGMRYVRPMVIKKNLLTNTTSMTALEVGL